MFNDAGFETHVFWQNFNFIGVIALKWSNQTCYRVL
jgi:hypothetical protein